MIDVIGVSFVDSNKIYYFLPNGLKLAKNDKVIVETEAGTQYGIVVTDYINIDPKKFSKTLKNVIRKVTASDERKIEKNSKDSLLALNYAVKCVDKLGLNMKMLSANYTFDRKQLFFNFVSDIRVDFRELAKMLAAMYKTRIELRQIGVRDKAKKVGGLGLCGRPVCCASFLDDMVSVSINMAKNQNMALNPQKINGVCGRLMCCLSYENANYNEYKKGLPKINQVVETPQGKGKVLYVDIFNRSYKVELEDSNIIEVNCK